MKPPLAAALCYNDSPTYFHDADYSQPSWTTAGLSGDGVERTSTISWDISTQSPHVTDGWKDTFRRQIPRLCIVLHMYKNDTTDSIRYSIRIRIVTRDSIRSSARTRMSDRQPCPRLELIVRWCDDAACHGRPSTAHKVLLIPRYCGVYVARANQNIRVKDLNRRLCPYHRVKVKRTLIKSNMHSACQAGLSLRPLTRQITSPFVFQ